MIEGLSMTLMLVGLAGLVRWRVTRRRRAVRRAILPM